MNELNLVQKRIAKVIADYAGIAEEHISADADFEAFDLDSLDEVEIIMEVEDEFMIEIPDDELSNVRTIAQLADIVSAKEYS
ncbi:hypothetical protein [Achromobacter phage Motura]|uniref:Carrier domain-containing protein n=1 Tax=Achromobacter phage Motura TaxID=2591403 RepID=A0A514CSL1_9CAUD|nr:acyl carrier protein [Achromobacter phage Motura]QDH83467.1 hypothetical protein [Achromobacter phage Motura]